MGKEQRAFNLNVIDPPIKPSKLGISMLIQHDHSRSVHKGCHVEAHVKHGSFLNCFHLMSLTALPEF